jgi:hypothetical protein
MFIESLYRLGLVAYSYAGGVEGERETLKIPV